MAEQRAQDVVDQTQSVGDVSPSDAPATTSTPDIKVSGEHAGVGEGVAKENGIHTPSAFRMEDFEDGSARSDTDTSRADGSVAGDKGAEPKSLKKFSAKPVSFAKYSVPKVIAANAAAKGGPEKATTPHSSASSPAPAGRPRLVAKTTSSLQQKAKPFKSTTPDPMQVWNKNRVTPQPSTKHLTDEELKQQYGIHLTSRLQTDSEGKEAKWADIDDDEDDWAPDTIEWNDGTKSILPPADATHGTAEKGKTETAPTPSPDQGQSGPPSKILTPPFTSSVGPNATVLKLGASAERQQALKAAAHQMRGPMDKATLTSSRTAPAPAPAKSPWAPLPPVDKVSPVPINPQIPAPPVHRYPSGHAYPQSPAMPALSPAKEISADDFNRSWREPSSGQPRELYMPSSGRYEAVPEGRRRMSKHDQSFRAPAVLQRPAAADAHAPAEPSAAFQTHRTSTDQARRRASSTISGGSGQFGRRMSIKSGETPAPVFEGPPSESDAGGRSMSRDGSSRMQTPTYQSRGTSDYIPTAIASATDADIEAQRAAQRALMKENIERARKRKIEEEQRLEAEKQERIRLKLASLGPAPKLTKVKADQKTEESTSEKETKSTAPPSVHSVSDHSPPKPPQPLATGEPQQYGMMKVHPLDSIKKISPAAGQVAEPTKAPSPATSQAKPDHTTLKDMQGDLNKEAPPTLNGGRAGHEVRPSLQESAAGPEPSPKFPKPTPIGAEARSGWADVRSDHRSPPSGNLWGLPNNKSLGNGTFDHTLAGYAPQDLSRTSSSAQGWMNGKSPNASRSPQTQYVNHHVPESRSYLHQPATSPDQPPLAVDSEADSVFPTTKPAPIAPPQPPQAHHPTINGFPSGPPNSTSLASWNNFHHVAGPDSERVQREMAAKREEELRTGIRQPPYPYSETRKPVHLGEQAGPRQASNMGQTSTPTSSLFGAVGSLPGADTGPRMMSGPTGRGSRFFPQSTHGYAAQDRRAFTYTHPEPPRTPSPPPAEEKASLHPAFDGDSSRPIVHFPREKAVVKLPPAMPPTPPTPVQPELASPSELQQQQLQSPLPLSWAARVSMPPPAPVSPFRAVSTPIVQNPSWQERFNGLLGKKQSPVRPMAQPAAPVLAVASSTREPFDVVPPAVSAAVSLPQHVDYTDPLKDAGLVTSKDVEDEDDLFEDREPGSQPTIKLPRETFPVQWTVSAMSRTPAVPVESTSVAPFLVNNWFERHSVPKPQFAIIHLPGSAKSTKKDIPIRSTSTANNAPRTRHATGTYGGKHVRHRAGPKSRQASKTH